MEYISLISILKVAPPCCALHATHFLFQKMLRQLSLFLALPLSIRAFEDAVTNLFFDNGADDADSYLPSDIAPLDEFIGLPTSDDSYLVTNDLSAASDFLLSPHSDLSSACLYPSSRRKREGGAEASFCPDVDPGGPLLITDPSVSLEKIVNPGMGITTQRETMEDVKEYWCAETSIPGFQNIPVCDSIFELDEQSQEPVHKSLDGPAPELGFFNIKEGWPREFFLLFIVSNSPTQDG